MGISKLSIRDATLQLTDTVLTMQDRRNMSSVMFLQNIGACAQKQDDRLKTESDYRF
jgi:hypothetical protein